MSIEAMTVVLHHSRARGTAKVVLLGIANHAGDGGAWPALSTLARYANVDRKTVKRAVKQLVDLGEVRVHVQAGGTVEMDDWTRPNRYDVLVRCPASCDRTTQHRVDEAIPLWIDGGTPLSPGDATVPGGGTPVSGGGGTPVSPKPSTQPDLTEVRDSPTDRARETSMPMCDECLQPWAECVARAKVSGHTYRPRRGHGHAAIAAVLDHYDDVRNG